MLRLHDHLHGDDTLLVTTVESGTQRNPSLVELFLRSLIEEVFLVMCLYVGVFQCFCHLVMGLLVWQTKLDLNLQ